MPKHFETRVLPYSSEEIFNLVSDIESYPEFLPWCIGTRILKQEKNIIYADLIVGFKLVREVYTSKVILQRPNSIIVEYEKGPFKYLINNWKIKEIGSECEVEFFIDFEFKSRFLRGVMGVFFGEAVNRMVTAFENRANVIYGQRS